jgi:hypothetical protein
MKESYFPRVFEKRVKNLYLGNVYEEFEGYVKNAQKRAVLHLGAPVGEHRWGCFLGPFEKERKCLSGFHFLVTRRH